MDTVNLNNSPDLTMEQITKQLFNNEFMSDVQFHVGEKVVFAHSWELMKRSLVFREQFKGNLGENKLITIEGSMYEAFYQFVRFIYTDRCEIADNTVCDMLDLSRRFKIVKLESQLMSFVPLRLDTDLMLLEYSLNNKYELIYNIVFNVCISDLNQHIVANTFLNLNSSSLEEILGSNQMPSNITGAKLYNSLVRWMDRSCEINQIPISQRRVYFNKLLQLIRFPLMTNDEFYVCVKNQPDLFTSDDISIICHTIILRDQYKIKKWSAEPRSQYILPYEKLTNSLTIEWKSKFTVSKKLILHGLRFGAGYCDFIIEITGQFGITNNRDVLAFYFVDSGIQYNTVSLGESIILKPNVDYTIEIKYLNDYSQIYCRKQIVNLIITGPSDLVTFTETSKALFEIFFKLPTN